MTIILVINQKGLAPILLILGIFIVLGLIGGGIYYQSLPRTNPEIIKSAPIPSPEISQRLPIASPSASSSTQITNWKIYQSNDISFQYPENGIIGDAGSVYPVYITSNTDPHFIFSVAWEDNPNHLNPKQVVERNADLLRENPNAPWFRDQADQMVQTMKNYDKGVIKGVYLQSFFEGKPSGFGTVIYTTDDKIYSFTIHNGDGYVTQNEERILEQILSTLKFTNN